MVRKDLTVVLDALTGAVPATLVALARAFFTVITRTARTVGATANCVAFTPFVIRTAPTKSLSVEFFDSYRTVTVLGI